MRVLTEVDQSERMRFVERQRPLAGANPTRDAQRFHQRLEGYEPTRLIDAPGIAAELGLSRLWVKDESSRFGLPAFKIMGASWAVFNAASQALLERTGQSTREWSSIAELAEHFAPIRPLTLTCATDGNHGRAVARMAALLGFSSRIIVPADMAKSRIDAIASEGAEIVIHDGSYDEAVARSASDAKPGELVISDTSWPGYEDVPGWVIAGYSTMLWEVDDELTRLSQPGPDLVAVQIGVGAFAAAVINHYRRPGVAPEPFILGVEPTHAACAIASIEACEIVEIPGPHDSIMSGLNCGVPSPLAWPIVSRGADAFIAIEDERTRVAMRLLSSEGIVAGECGAAGLGGLIAWRDAFGGNLADKCALIISTEGATDPGAYTRILAGGA